MIQLIAVFAGSPADFGPGGQPSAIRKQRVAGPLAVERMGLGGDSHADQIHHGGPERAVHHYSYDHYSRWREEYPEQSSLFERPGLFGENLATCGLSESTVCVGDLYRIGTALLQVSEPRQPCWKPAHRTGLPELARRIQETGRTGWFYRVVEEGTLQEGDEVSLVERPCANWPLERVLHILFVSPLERGELEAMAVLAQLAPSMRELAVRRLSSGVIEPWERRLTIPVA